MAISHKTRTSEVKVQRMSEWELRALHDVRIILRCLLSPLIMKGFVPVTIHDYGFILYKDRGREQCSLVTDQDPGSKILIINKKLLDYLGLFVIRICPNSPSLIHVEHCGLGKVGFFYTGTTDRSTIIT